MPVPDSNRLASWRALSDLFLDTELDEAALGAIARAVRQTGYSVQQAHDILWIEVFPALEANLRSVTGEWAGWSDAWLLAHLQVRAPRPILKRGAVAAEIDRCWQTVVRQLAADAT